MTRWAIVDMSNKIINNFIEAETFEIADKATSFNQTPIECPPENNLDVVIGYFYDEESNSFLSLGEYNAKVQL